MKTCFSIWFYISRFIMLFILFIVFFILGSLFVEPYMPDIASEPGLLSAEVTILIMGIMNTLLIMTLIESSIYRSWKLALALAFAYYGAVNFVMQIETWYFLDGITVSNALLQRLFLMGIPIAFFYIPLAVLLMGKKKLGPEARLTLKTGNPLIYWLFRLTIIALIYITLYWIAGYFIAWQNPELRAFYGSPGEAVPFLTHTLNTIKEDPFLFPFQALRSLLWTLFALPIIYGSRWSKTVTALLVGFLFSVPQNIAHLIENPLMPISSVRFSHMVETTISTFIFGVIVVLLFYPESREDKIKNQHKGIIRTAGLTK